MTQTATHIFLIGFMGSGKSTVAAKLAVELQRPCLDLDAQIVASCRCSIAAIFRDQGETRFRQLETEALTSLRGTDAAIVATGGGIVGRAENWHLMRELGIIVYLQARWETLQLRLQRNDERPLANPEQGWEPVHQLLQQRLPLYAQADLTIDTEGLAPAEVARAIAVRLASVTRIPWKK